MKIDLSNMIAAGMSQALEDNKSLFTIEKLASQSPIVQRVSEQDKGDEVEAEMVEKEASVKTAGNECLACKGYYVKDKSPGQCTCTCENVNDCKKGCACHMSPAKPAISFESTSSEVIETLLKVSEDLDNIGMDKFAAITIVLANKISEAKAKKKSKKSTEKSSTKDSKKSDKAPSKSSKKSTKEKSSKEEKKSKKS